jgi:hypothetical protein
MPAMGKWPISKQDLKEKTVLECLGRLRGLVLGGRPGGQDRRVTTIIGHMSFRFPIDFMFIVLGPCESLRMLKELTVGHEQNFSFPVHFCLCFPHLSLQAPAV